MAPILSPTAGPPGSARPRGHDNVRMATVLDGVLSARALAELAGEPVFSRGADYVPRVRSLTVSAGQARAGVRGQESYAVELRWAAGVIDGDCTCPHFAGGHVCKHLVAVGLAAIDTADAPRATKPQPEAPAHDSAAENGDDAFSRYLATLSPAELCDLVVELAAESESATRRLQVRATVAAGDTESVAAELVAAVQAGLASRGFVDYRRSFDVARGAQDLLDELENHLDSGAADAVRPALQKAVTRLRSITERADDSGGAIGTACQRAADLFARSCREGHPDPAPLGRWLVKFRVSSPGWPNTVLGDFVDALGDKGLAAYRKGAKAADAAHAGEDHWQRFEIDQMLLELADHDGDVDRAVELLRRGEQPEYGAIVERLERAGRQREAMATIDRAVDEGRLSVGRSNTYWLGARDVAERYLADGRPEDALAMLRDAFAKEPGAAAYRLLTTYAARLGQEADQRAWAHDHARAVARSGRGGALLVELHLADDDLDGAWAATDEFGPGHQWHALAQASAAAYPRRAADLYRPDLERLLHRSDTRNYPEVARTLTTMRDLYAQAGQVDEIDAEIRLLRETYRRRTSLMAALDKAGLPTG